MLETVCETPAVVSHEHDDVPQLTLLRGIGIAVPENQAPQEQTMEFALGVMGENGAVQQSLIKRIYKHSGISYRHSVLGDYVKSDPEDFTFYPQNWELSPVPGTGARMAAYEKHALPLAAQAAARAIKSAGIAPESVTHLVISTCTGFFAPGLDVLLLRELGMNLNVQRTILGFMGCYAGISGIRTCQQIVQSDANAVVLQVAVELCSLHYQTTQTVETVVSNAIFSDGAAAAVYSSATDIADEENTDGAMAVVVAAHSAVSPDSLDRMSWRIGDHGFIMTLDAGVPDILMTQAPAFTQQLAAAAGIEMSVIDGWAIHPGGRKIIEAIQESMGLSSEEVDSSVSVLRDYGNMSSATILFVLQRELERRDIGSTIAAMAFGPGLTMEGALLRRI